MNYTIEGTTKRYKGNFSCSYPTFIPQKNDLCQYGCEFEFYIDTERQLTLMILKPCFHL